MLYVRIQNFPAYLKRNFKISFDANKLTKRRTGKLHIKIMFTLKRL